MKRLASLCGVAAASTLAGAVFSPSAHASTLGSCQLTVPSQVRITGEYQHIRPTLSGGCTYYASSLFATWYGYTSKGSEDMLLFDHATATDWDVYDWMTPGVVTWRPGGSSEDRNYNDFSQNRPTTDVRYGAWAGLHVAHKGAKVTLSANGSRWSATWRSPIANQTTAVIQYKNIGSNTWTTLKSQAVNGSFSVSYNTTAKRDYRVTYNTTKYVWAAMSPTVRG